MQRFSQPADVVLQRIGGEVAEDREGRRDADPTHGDGADRQHHQRDGHPGEDAVVLVGVRRRGRPRLPEEGHQDLAHRVEGGEQGAERQDDKHDVVPIRPRIRQDLILAPEAGGHDGEPAQRQPADEESPGRARHLAEQPAHIAHVLGIEGG